MFNDELPGEDQSSADYEDPVHSLFSENHDYRDRDPEVNDDGAEDVIRSIHLNADAESFPRSAWMDD